MSPGFSLHRHDHDPATCCMNPDVQSGTSGADSKWKTAAPVEEEQYWTVTLQHSGWDKTTSVKVYPETTVYHIKKLVRVLTGVPCDHQILTFAGYCLHNDLHVEGTHMFAGCTAKLVILPPIKAELSHHADSVVNIFVKTMTGIKLELWVEPSWTVQHLKELLEQYLGPPPNQQRVVFAGQQLESAHILQDYGVKQGYVLHLVLRGKD